MAIISLPNKQTNTHQYTCILEPPPPHTHINSPLAHARIHTRTHTHILDLLASTLSPHATRSTILRRRSSGAVWHGEARFGRATGHVDVSILVVTGEASTDSRGTSLR